VRPPPGSGDRRGARVAAVTPGPDRRGSRFTGDAVDLPVILIVALAAANTSVEAFIARLARGSIWQDQAIRSADRQIVIQAHLAPEGLRAVVQIGEAIWYHHPLDTIHAYGITAADAGKAAGNVGLSSILRHPLLDHLKMDARTIVSLNNRNPDLGVSIALDVPRVRYAFPHDSSKSADAS